MIGLKFGIMYAHSSIGRQGRVRNDIFNQLEVHIETIAVIHT